MFTFTQKEMEKLYSALVSNFGENVDLDTMCAQFYYMHSESKNEFDSDLKKFIESCSDSLEVLSHLPMVWNYELDRKNCLKELHSIGFTVNEIPKGTAALWKMCRNVKAHKKVMDILKNHYFLVDRGEPCDFCDIYYAGHYGR